MWENQPNHWRCLWDENPDYFDVFQIRNQRRYDFAVDLNRTLKGIDLSFYAQYAVMSFVEFLIKKIHKKSPNLGFIQRYELHEQYSREFRFFTSLIDRYNSMSNRVLIWLYEIRFTTHINYSNLTKILMHINGSRTLAVWARRTRPNPMNVVAFGPL